MANLIEISEQLKGVPDQWLQQQVENPSGAVPPYLALSELNRRKSLRSKMAQSPTSTVAQDVVGAPAPAMATSDQLNQRQTQPQLPQSPQPGLPSPASGGLQAMQPPAPQGPPAPQRMAGGGVIRMAGGGLFGSSFLPGERAGMPEEYWKRNFPWMNIHTPRTVAGDRVSRGGSPQASFRVDENGNRIMTVNGQEVVMPAYKSVDLPEWKDLTPKSVAIPKLDDVLAEVQRVTARPDTGPTALDKRVAALDEMAAKVRRPRTGDALMDLGFGLMASRSPYGLQALGEAGMGATQNWRQRQDAADRQQLGLADRLAQIEQSREEQAERSRRADLQLADSLAQRQYGASTTDAQLDAQRQASQQRYELAKYEAANQAAGKNYELDTGLNKALVAHLLNPPKPDNIDPYGPEGVAARMKIDENQARVNSLYRKHTGEGYGGLGKFMQGHFVNDFAKTLMAREYPKWTVGQGDKVPDFLARLQPGLAAKIMSGEIDDPLFQADPRLRYMVAMAAGGMKFDPKDPFLAGIQSHITTGKAGGAGKTAEVSPQQVSGDPQQGVKDYSGSTRQWEDPPAAPANRYQPGQPAWAPKQEKKYIPWNPDAGKLYPKPRGVPDELMNFGGKPVASLNPNEYGLDEYLRQLGYAV